MNTSMRIFLTGGTGFIGMQVAERLRERGDNVVAVIRDLSRASRLSEIGCELVSVNLNDTQAVRTAMRGSDVVVHLAGRFQIGVPASERDAFISANAGIAETVIDAAIAESVDRIVYASTINVFGDTRGAIVSETHRREGKFLSLYDESKHRAHEVALARAKSGAPVLILQPGSVYGPGDHFELGREILLAANGKLRLLMLGDVGLTMSYLDDVAGAFVAATTQGRIGESYVIGGEITRLRDVLRTAAEIGGHNFNPLVIPTPLLKAIAPLGPVIAPRLGYPPNLHELIRVSDRSTYWADSGKAQRELGYEPRSLEEGLKALLGK